MPTVPLLWEHHPLCVFATVILRDPRNPRDSLVQFSCDFPNHATF
jgi:hypothetical protein